MLIRRAVLGLLTFALLVPATASAIPNTGPGGGTGPVPTGEFPVATFAAPSSSVVGQAVLLDASASYDPDGTIVRYEWDLNGDGQYDRSSTASRTSYIFGSYLNYTVRLRVTDNRGNASTATHVIV